jgi:outer membrane receptor protein involved in Fe transport
MPALQTYSKSNTSVGSSSEFSLDFSLKSFSAISRQNFEARPFMKNTFALRACFIFTALFLLAPTLSAQTTDTGTIRGRVLDPNGALVTNAQVTVTNEQIGLTRTVQTDANGTYAFANLPLTGKYKVSVTSQGFSTKVVDFLELRASETATIDVTLELPLIGGDEFGRNGITVYGTTEGIQNDSARLSTRLDLQKINETPVLNRRVTNLVALNSASRPARGTGDLFLNNYLFVINGGGRRQTSFVIDGSTGDDAWGRQTIFTSLPFSTLQEFTVLTNPASAEYGRTTGGVVNVVTKSGTNDFHFETVGVARPIRLEANAPLALPGQQTGDRLGQISGVFSGPIARDKTWFLVGAEYTNQRRSSVITSALAPGAFTGEFQQGLLFARIDHRLNERNDLRARGNFDLFTDTNPADAVGGTNLPSAARTFRRRTYIGQLTETATFSPNAVNEARAQIQIGSPITQFIPVNPSVQFVRPGLSTEGESRSAFLINHQYQLADTLTYLRGNHSFKFGGDATFSSSGGSGTEFGTGFVLGQFRFKNASNVTNPNIPTSALTLNDVQSFTQSFGNANYNVREWLYSVFAQDDWRVRPNLTLNLGLRYERQTFTDDTNNFAPRVGFAYNLFNDQKTILRGSYGIYYSELRANLGAQFALNGINGVFTFTAAPGQLGFPTSFAPLPAFPAGAVLPPRDIVIRPGRAAFYSQFFDVSKLRGYPDKLLNPYTQQATIGIERELPYKFILKVDYVYAHTLKIDRTLDLNAPALFVRTSPTQTRSAAAADATRPITPVPNGFKRIQSVINNGSSLYNGMQLNLMRRFANRFSLLASYTWSHTINDVEPDSTTDPNDANQIGVYERADSLLDQRHRAVLSGWLDLPLRFTVGGVTTLASARPYNITTGADTNGDGATTDRPVINGVVIPRNAGRGTPIRDVSVFVEKSFVVMERVQLSVRAEGFNIFNHNNIVGRNGVYYSNAATATVSPTFAQPLGGIANVDPGRQFQFVFRVRY